MNRDATRCENVRFCGFHNSGASLLTTTLPMLTRILQTSCGTRCKQTLCINSAQHYSSLASTDHAPKRLRRALQYVPGSFAPEKLSKAIRGPADGYVLDLEDSVSEDRKDLARSQVGSSVVYLALVPTHAFLPIVRTACSALYTATLTSQSPSCL